MTSSPFVYTYSQFPTDDPTNLQKQLVNQSTQFGTAINQRTIGVFQLHNVGFNDAIADGETWFPATIEQKLRSGHRLVIQVSDAVLTVNHNIPLINQITRLYGAFQDGAGVWQTLPYVDVVAANNQIRISVSATQVVVTKGGGAPPAIANGIVVCEFL